MEITQANVSEYTNKLQSDRVNFRGGQLYLSPSFASNSDSANELIQTVRKHGISWLKPVTHFAADPNDPYIGARAKYRGELGNGITIIGKEKPSVYDKEVNSDLDELAFAELLADPIRESCRTETLTRRGIPADVQISYASERPVGAIHFYQGHFFKKTRREILLFEWINGNSVNGVELVHRPNDEFFGYPAGLLIEIVGSTVTDVFYHLKDSNINWFDGGVHQTITTVEGNRIKVNIVDFAAFRVLRS